MSTTRHPAKQRPPRDLSGLSFAFFGRFLFWPSYHQGSPEQVARRMGATIRRKVDENLDDLVLGDGRGAGRAEARKTAQRLHARAAREGGKGKRPLRPQVLDEAGYRDLVGIDLHGKSFAFFGGFDCCPTGFDDALLTRMVEAAGGVVRTEVDEKLDYLVLGNRRGPGKVVAQHRAEELRSAGHPVQTLDETRFLELVRSEGPPRGSVDFAEFISQLYERRRLMDELMDMQRGRRLEPFIIDNFNERIGQLSKEIAAATSPPDFMGWWQQVQEEIDLLKRQQEQVQQAVETGSYIQKAEAIRSLIECIVCHWATVPTTDKRYKTGVKTVCRAVTIRSKETAKTTEGQPIETMTIETPSARSS